MQLPVLLLHGCLGVLGKLWDVGDGWIVTARTPVAWWYKFICGRSVLRELPESN